MLKFWEKCVKTIVAHKAISITVASLASVAIIGIGGYEIFKTLEEDDVTSDVVVEEVVVEDEIEAAELPSVPSFQSVIISSESVEKDLTVYISDTQDVNVEGTNFSIKLMEPSAVEALTPYINAIEEINEQIKTVSDQKTADVTSVKIVNSDGAVVSAESKLAALDQLYVDKEVALQAYGIALDEAEGEVLVDDDANGVIEKSDMKPGDYVACLLYDENWVTNFDPVEYATTVNVKDKLEMKIVANIKKKIAKDVSSEDGQKKNATEVEATLADTVAFVESTDKVVTKIESTNKVSVTGSTTTMSARMLSSEADGKSSHSFEKSYYSVTIIKKYYTQDGKIEDIIDTNESVVAGGTYTIRIPSEEGYSVACDYSDGAQIKVDGNITVNIVYTAVQQGSGSDTGSETSAVQTDFLTSNNAAASDDSVGGSATLTSSFSNGKLTINLETKNDAKASNLNVNGSGIEISKSPYTYNVTKEGKYKIECTISYSDGTKETIFNEWEVTGKSEGGDTKLVDEKGRQLYVDKDCKKEATVSDYENGTKTFYYKVETHVYTGFQSINGVTYYFDADGNKVTGTQVINGVKYNFGSDGGLMVSGTGIDVSKYQGNIDWAQAKSAVSFAIVRCGYRGMNDGILHEDPYFYKNMKNAKANGVAVGVYIYSTALNEAEAVEEASMAVSMAQAAGGCSYPIYIDMEDSVRGVSKLTNEQRTAIINAFCATVQSAGYKSGVYANKTWLSQKINTSGLSGSVQVWVAQYNTSCTYSGHYTMWQYSSKGSIPGIKGNVDVNKSYF